ncbi:hypothetical protein KIPB_003068, partial [Kipferlia bialata]|eukprot:g3068.t1
MPVPELEDSAVHCRSTECARCEREGCATLAPGAKGPALKGQWSCPPRWTDAEIINESRRCLYCADARCNTSCAAQINVKDMIHAAGEHNFYAATKAILGANPLGLSTAFLCQCDEMCQGGCSLANTAQGSIKTADIQRWVLENFAKLNITQTRDPKIAPKAESVAVVGAGPAGLSAATFLARWGYKVTVIDAAPRAGGLLVSELPEWRLPLEAVDFEVRMAEEIGVEFRFNTKFGSDACSIETLKAEGFSAVFLGCGKPGAAPVPFPVEGVESGIVDSHTFLRSVNLSTKLNVPGKTPMDLSGKRVVVVGAGDTALDCAQTAYRLGAEHVTVAFRKQVSDMRAAKNRLAEALAEDVELMPLVEPVKVNGNDAKALDSVVFKVNKKSRAGKYVATGLQYELDCDYLILCLGARPVSLLPKSSTDPKTMQIHAAEGELALPVFAGGDSSNSVSVVEAVNDGRCAATHIHALLSGNPSVVNEAIPGFHTAVDEVSLKTEFCGMTLENPFGPSSAPISATLEQIERAYDAGFGFTITKTCCLTKDISGNNHVRIVRVNTHDLASASFQNICMITEHPFEYWLDTVRTLRAKYPHKGLVVSVMCMDKQEDWVEACTQIAEALGDGGNVGIELNFSCPNECHGAGDDGEDAHAGGFDSENAMAMAIGTDVDAVERCTRYCVECVPKNIPIFAKLTPNTAIIEQLANAAIRGGAAGVTAINTVNGLAKVFPSGHPWPRVGTQLRAISGGLSGDQILPIAI